MKIALLTTFSILIIGCTSNPKPSEVAELPPSQKEVRQVILDLFQAMYDGDSSSAHLQFIDSARMYSTFIIQDNIQFKEGTINQFMTAIGTPHDDHWIEKTWNYDIKVDGTLAQVWCEYAFFAGERFSHCGVDAFQLLKTSVGWKIFIVTDTRRKTACVFPTGAYFEPE
ncbi:MAG: hypothetical protein OCD76_13555 [Reichenbachiella sp.]